MSNEELVAAIQSGEDRMGELWEQVRGFVAMRARRIMPSLEGRADIDLDDLVQSGYLALAAAVAGYKHSEASFITFLGYHLKTAFAEATHFRSQREQRETKSVVLSLDAPATNAAENDLTLGDRLLDTTAAAILEEVEDRIWLDQLRKSTANALQNLPEAQRELLRLRFWEGATLKELAQRLGISIENVRQRERNALQALRKPGTANRLRPYYDFDFYAGAGFSAFRNSGMTIQDRYLIFNESRHEREHIQDNGIS